MPTKTRLYLNPCCHRICCRFFVSRHTTLPPFLHDRQPHRFGFKVHPVYKSETPSKSDSVKSSGRLSKLFVIQTENVRFKRSLSDLSLDETRHFRSRPFPIDVHTFQVKFFQFFFDNNTRGNDWRDLRRPSPPDVSHDFFIVYSALHDPYRPDRTDTFWQRPGPGK